MATMDEDTNDNGHLQFSFHQKLPALVLLTALLVLLPARGQTLLSVEIGQDDLASFLNTNDDQSLSADLPLAAELGESAFVGTNVEGDPVLEFPSTLTFEQASVRVEEKLTGLLKIGRLVQATPSSFA